MTTPKRRYIDELMDGIRFSSGGPVSISLETAKRLKELYQEAVLTQNLPGQVEDLDEDMPEPKP